jgi:hypothetical protein
MLKVAESSPRAKGASERPIALVFHAEKLHVDHVWREVEKVAHRLAARDVRATFFVYSFPAAVAAVDITARVRWLGSLGHEIAQHTHFYAGSRIRKNEKVDDLSDANVVHCLQRDFEALRQSGFLPKGFTAGSWYVNDTVLSTLIGLGFDYDCSAQLLTPRAAGCSPHQRWLGAPQFFDNTAGRLLCLPTTCSLGQWFKSAARLVKENQAAYQLIYLHDYDLLNIVERSMLHCFLKITKGRTLVPSASIARYYLYSDGERCGSEQRQV